MDKETKAEIGKRLRAKREAAGYTREQLSELCSLSPRFLANVELGDSAFSLDTLMTVCKIPAAAMNCYSGIRSIKAHGLIQHQKSVSLTLLIRKASTKPCRESLN